MPQGSVSTEAGWVSVPVSAQSVAGTQYAIVLDDSTASSIDSYAWSADDEDPYAAGSAPETGVDFAFKTYVADTAAPTVTCSASPATLKSNNHRLASVTTSVTVADESGGSGSAGFTLVSVQSNQADGGLGPGDLANDIQGWASGTADTSGLLRTERYGVDRVYTFTYQGSDLAGNPANCQATVTIKKGT